MMTLETDEAPDLVTQYERLEAITSQMLEAAKTHDWQAFELLGQSCAIEVEAAKRLAAERVSPLDEARRLRKVSLIESILKKDRAIRELTMPWMREVENLLRTTRQQKRLQSSYSGGPASRLG